MTTRSTAYVRSPQGQVTATARPAVAREITFSHPETITTSVSPPRPFFRQFTAKEVIVVRTSGSDDAVVDLLRNGVVFHTSTLSGADLLDFDSFTEVIFAATTADIDGDLLTVEITTAAGNGLAVIINGVE